MIDTATFLLHARLDAQRLDAWVAAGWLQPDPDDGQGFSTIDVARAQLIHDLTDDLGVNDEGVGIILNLIDQIHGLRGALRGLLAAVQAQPEAMRRKLVADIRRLADEQGQAP